MVETTKSTSTSMPLKYTEDVDTLLSRLFFERGTEKEKRCI